MRLKVFVLAAVLVGALAATANAASVDIGHGRTMFLTCRGHGGPTVVQIEQPRLVTRWIRYVARRARG